jgi:signal transduction histidine kinase/ligand-binding sensor domain-containing protein
VRDIVQTRDGYLWLATLDGLVRFDGVRFTVFNKSNSPGIVSNRFLQLYEAGQGDLWATTENNGLTRLHEGQFITYSTAQGLPNTLINSIGGDGQGNLVLFVGLHMFRWHEDKFQPADELRLSANLVPSDKTQHLPGFSDLISKGAWFVNGQVSRWNAADLPSTLHPFPGMQDGQGNAWFSSAEGLIKIGNNQIVKEYTPLNGLPGKETRLVFGRLPMQAFSRKNDGSLWLTDLDSMQSQLVKQKPPEGFDLIIAYADREGNYWFGTGLNGLFRARRQAIMPYTKAQGLTAREVYPILEDRTGTIWLGGIGGGLYRFQNGRFSRLSPSASTLSYDTSLFEDRAGRVWANGRQCYVEGRLERSFREQVLPPEMENCNAMYEDHEGALWFGTDRGVMRYKDGVRTRFTTRDGLAGDDTKVIIGDQTGGLWLGSYGGLTQFRDGRFTAWIEADGLPGNTVRALKQDGDGTLWIGTYDSGLGRFRDGKFTRYTTKEGLFDNGVFQILEDDFGWVWMSCNRGIYRVRKQELNDFGDGKISTVTSVSFGKSDGMENVECNGGRWPAGIRARDGKLWFPTMGGVAVIDPATVTTSVQPPSVVIEAARIDNQAVTTDLLQSALYSPNAALRLEPRQNNFEIQYTALSFINSENLKFKYKLEGQDPDWVEAGTRRTAYYSYLPPGEYTFRVIAANRDGVWNMEGRSLRIRVLPAFYRTWWFLILLGLTASGAVYGVFKYRITQVELRQSAQQAFAHQLIESQEAERQRIAAELHDSLGQHLLVIRNRAALGERAVQDPVQSRIQFDEITASATQAISEVRAISQNLRPVNLNRLGLAATIEEMVEKVAASSGIQFSADIEAVESGGLTKEQEVNCFRIIQESLNNIIKHAQATKAYVELWRADGNLLLTVRDNGRGFTVESAGDGAGRGLGLTSIAERVQMLGGTHTIKSMPGEGTSLDIQIPLVNRKAGKNGA